MGNLGSRIRTLDLWFWITLAFLVGFEADYFSHHLNQIGFFDSSEFSSLILGNGIAHAPGYPLYVWLGKLFYPLTQNPFTAQHLVSFFSLFLLTLFFWNSFTIHPRYRFLALITLYSTFTLKLFTIIPEVFILNLALFAALGLAIQRWFSSNRMSSAFFIFLIYGLGLSHHHTLALTLPSFALLIHLKWAKEKRESPTRAELIGAALGLVVGSLPLLYLIRPSVTQSLRTYHPIQSFSDFLFVLFRQGYGTFSLSGRVSAASFFEILQFSFLSLVKGFNYILCFLFLPWLSLKRIQRFQKNPLFIYSACTLMTFVLFFLPRANIELTNASYQNTFLRFITIPILLLSYFLPHAFRSIFCHLKGYGLSQKASLAFLTLLIVSTNWVSFSELNYHDFPLLIDHIEEGYKTVFQELVTKEVRPTDGTYPCILLADSDTLLFSLLYYNDYQAQKKCYIFSFGYFQGHFRFQPEEDLLKKELGVPLLQQIREKLAHDPLGQLKLVLTELDKKGYPIYIFYSPDFTYFYNSSFGFRPIGNILQLVGSRAVDSHPSTREKYLKAYLQSAETYLHSLQVKTLPSSIIDQVAASARFQNLTEYLKYNSYFKEPLPHQDALFEKALELKSQLSESPFN